MPGPGHTSFLCRLLWWEQKCPSECVARISRQDLAPLRSLASVPCVGAACALLACQLRNAQVVFSNTPPVDGVGGAFLDVFATGHPPLLWQVKCMTYSGPLPNIPFIAVVQPCGACLSNGCTQPSQQLSTVAVYNFSILVYCCDDCVGRCCLFAAVAQCFNELNPSKLECFFVFLCR